MWLGSLPVVLINSPGISELSAPAYGSATDITGLVFFVVGLAVEAGETLAPR